MGRIATFLVRMRLPVRRALAQKQMAVYAGFPAARNGLFAAKDVFFFETQPAPAAME